ncbi:MAG TPA: carboxypeptidase regulatory-like domain-containing protein [Thermoanaerobaculia bacterium]|nr:carboxypeptidase regulatory-like domain-containing protein [Thermoanaerobaculia bacterium]
MRRNHRWIVLALALASLAACAGEGGDVPEASDPAEVAASPVDEATAGGIRGTVRYAGPDTDTPIDFKADPKCAGMHQGPVDTGAVDARDGHLANVFVYVKSGLEKYKFPVPADKKVLDQQGCLYQPRVSGIMAGQTLVVKNSDATVHNVHALPKANREFNSSQPFANMELEKQFDKPEVMVHFKCDVHRWMSAWLGVLPHPYYAVSAADGAFSLDKLPPGTYTVEAWHETLGTQTQQVTVSSKQTAEITFDFPPKA